MTDTAPRTGRNIPHDLTAERALLGAMLLSGDAIDAADERLQPGDYFDPTHGAIHAACITLRRNGRAVDTVSVLDQLGRDGASYDLTGVELAALLEATPSIGSADTYAGIVATHATARRLIAAGGAVSDLGYQPGADIDVAVGRAEQLILNVARHGVADSSMSMADLTASALEEIAWRRDNADDYGLTGLYDVDRMLGPIRPGNLITVGARPAMGKTAFGVGIARHIALEVGLPALVFSLEMSKLEVAERLLSAERVATLDGIRNAHRRPEVYDAIAQAAHRFAEAPLEVVADSSLTLPALAAHARRVQKRLGSLGVVVVDYIQLLGGDARVESRQLEVSAFARGLKQLAGQLRVPIVALSQLSRSLESRQDKRPMLSDLRESGEIEQASDAVMFLYRDDQYFPETARPNEVEVLVAKHRHGQANVRARCYFDGPHVAIRNMART